MQTLGACKHWERACIGVCEHWGRANIWTVQTVGAFNDLGCASAGSVQTSGACKHWVAAAMLRHRAHRLIRRAVLGVSLFAGFHRHRRERVVGDSEWPYWRVAGVSHHQLNAGVEHGSGSLGYLNTVVVPRILKDLRRWLPPIPEPNIFGSKLNATSIAVERLRQQWYHSCCL